MEQVSGEAATADFLATRPVSVAEVTDRAQNAGAIIDAIVAQGAASPRPARFCVRKMPRSIASAFLSSASSIGLNTGKGCDTLEQTVRFYPAAVFLASARLLPRLRKAAARR